MRGGRTTRPERASSTNRSGARPKSSIPPVVRSKVRKYGGVREIQRSLPGRKDLLETARLLEAASDPSRLRILAALNRSPLCPCLLQQIAPMKDAVLSYHLKILRDVGLVRRASVSNFRVYDLTPQGRQLELVLRRASSVRRRMDLGVAGEL
jgi:DNA-binding transcriptional ArsR family regulator